MASEPTDPITVLGSAAAQHHEIYLAYVEAGFRPDQAMQIITTMIAEIVRAGLDDDE